MSNTALHKEYAKYKIFRKKGECKRYKENNYKLGQWFNRINWWRDAHIIYSKKIANSSDRDYKSQYNEYLETSNERD